MLAESGLISAKPEQFTHWHNAMDARWLERMHLPASGGLPFDGDFWPSGKIYFQATFLVCPATKSYSADFSGPFEVFRGHGFKKDRSNSALPHTNPPVSETESPWLAAFSGDPVSAGNSPASRAHVARSAKLPSEYLRP
jgi:hypothetical protein